tara:strand:+ start:155 stop:772 length:618 start_codon:yes stop_codon:yes gene_type:complete
MTKKNLLLIEKIINALPQLQCQKCEYDDCSRYAEAVVLNQEAIDKCEPGSKNTAKLLENILSQTDAEIKTQKIKKYNVATIKSNNCIGCKICLNVCPVDAIIGAKHQIHYIVEDLCNGCELCIPQCPVDCMEMIENKKSESWVWPSSESEKSKKNYYQKLKRTKSQKTQIKDCLDDLTQESQIKKYIKDAIKKESIRREKVKIYE